MFIRKKQIQKYLTQPTDMMKGSITESYRSCGKPSCKKCQQGQLHHGYFFSFAVKGKQKMFYIPKKDYNQVKKLVESWHRHKDHIEELTDINLQLVRKGLFKENNK